MPKRKVQAAITNFVIEKNEDPKTKKTKLVKVVDDKVEPAPINKTDSDYSSFEVETNKTTKDGKKWNFKISSWNVVSLKSIAKKKGLEFIKHENPDVICFQETKCSEKDVPVDAKVEGYHRYFVASEKPGYAGAALYSKTKPLSVSYGINDKTHDSEGRVITAEYDQFYIVTAYVPNSGRGLVTLTKRMKWDPDFRNYLKELDVKKPVILCGDLNVAHNPIDLKNPKTNTKTAGYTIEEREGMTALLNEGFVDTFRHLYPEQEGAYTFWSYLGNARKKNVGWRIDYFIVSERLLPSVCDNVIRSEVFGSDHCPITLFINT